ncbi:MAG: tRNA (adenosine(37)-N6)-dimethylallyltransferase MiaA [Bacteroidetes bacterium HGW-Bacteroidetes-17]|jgi:tRNA dimethylallyltransferase|nr:MAG: tRNA (adenosine(37)-N6)-dimethylallyltransferase MiaA [Bacteroidetes bacterium HGW-Bacteroidetes-17]
MDKQNNLITILGPTATGKTRLAAELASLIDGEIISADSRQVYRGMDLGTGKDLQDYEVNGKIIPYHLIDIVDPGYEYNIFEFQNDFLKAYQDIINRDKKVILCGGSGMYLDAVLKGYHLIQVPENVKLRNHLALMNEDLLKEKLLGFGKVHNETDLTDRNRLIRAIEIREFEKDQPLNQAFPEFNSLNFGIHFEREEIRKRITLRLKTRLENGMIDEVKGLLEKGFTSGQLMFYGLEYKYVTQYVNGEIRYNDLYQKLNTAIHQFAKRQMTWFRRMEKQGVQIHWIPGDLSSQKKLKIIYDLIKKADRHFI